MDKWLKIAGRLLPDILLLTAGPQAAGVLEMVKKSLIALLGTDNPDEAQAKLDKDPAISDEARIRLAEIAADAEAKRRQADLDAQKLQLEDAQKKQAAQFDVLRAQLEDRDKQRQTDAEELKGRFADVSGARSSFLELATARAPMAWGAPIVSVVVTTGFFVILVVMFSKRDWPAAEAPAFQLLNIALGALVAAFTTVVTFWLGSSIGSRNKDAQSFDLQTQQARNTTDIVQKQVDQAGAVLAKEPAVPPVPTQDAAKGPAPSKREPNFRACVDIVLAGEGGFSNHPQDPGGATNFGITQRTLQAWRRSDVSVEDVQKLTIDEARQIYQAAYWNVLNCDNLPKGVDLVVFDFGVNAGPARSAKLLQKVVGANQDGAIGPATLAAVAVMKAPDIIRRFGELRLEYYRGLDGWDTFGNGWKNRTAAVEDAALRMAG